MSQQSIAPFFVTRQSANILQDLARRCDQAGSISVLHGRAGVGKSRLLARFTDLYADGFFCLYLCCDEEERFYHLDQPQKLLSQQQIMSFVERHLHAQSVLLIDQFEYLNAQARSSIFEFWQTQAMARQLNLILGVSGEPLATLKQQAKTLALDIASVEVLPLRQAEQMEFIRLHCCPDRNQIPKLSRRQTAALLGTEGVFSNLVLFLQQQGGEIACKGASLPVADSNPGHGLPALLLVVLAVLASGFLVWHLQVDIVPPGTLIQNQTDSDRQIQQTVAPKIINDQRVEDVQPFHNLPLDAPDQKLTGSHLAFSAPEKTLQVLQVKSKNLLQAEPLSSIDHREKPPYTHAPVATSTNPLVQHAFHLAELWLAKTQVKGASIQIMTLTENDRSYRALEDYLQEIKHRGVDIEQMMMFRFMRRKQGMIGVLYGRYRDLDTAKIELGQLPSALKSNHPMMRTIEGINKDRKENEN